MGSSIVGLILLFSIPFLTKSNPLSSPNNFYDRYQRVYVDAEFTLWGKYKPSGSEVIQIWTLRKFKLEPQEVGELTRYNLNPLREIIMINKEICESLLFKFHKYVSLGFMSKEVERFENQGAISHNQSYIITLDVETKERQDCSDDPLISKFSILEKVSYPFQTCPSQTAPRMVLDLSGGSSSSCPFYPLIQGRTTVAQIPKLRGLSYDFEIKTDKSGYQSNYSVNFGKFWDDSCKVKENNLITLNNNLAISFRYKNRPLILDDLRF